MTGDFIRDALAARSAANRVALEAKGFPVAPHRTPPTPDPTDIGALRRRIAGEKGVPPDAVERLRGSTRAELVADADELLSAVPAVEPYKFAEAEDFGAGARRSTATPVNVDEKIDRLIREASGR